MVRLLSKQIESLEPRQVLAAFGIDVSHYQGAIDWSAVAAAGKEFAFIKASEGVTYADPTFVGNVQAARAAGVTPGAYHFARPLSNSAASEATHFAAVIRDYLTDRYLRPALDLEVGAELGATALSNWVNTFSTALVSLTGVEPIVYVNSNYSQNYLDTSVAGLGVWIANWGNNDGQFHPERHPGTGVWGGQYAFWQYTSNGAVPGIAGRVDLDYFAGDDAAFESQFVIGGGVAAVVPLQGADVGNPRLPGATELLNSTDYDLSGSGAGPQKRTDSIHFASREQNGDFSITTRLTAVQGKGKKIRTGVMARASLDSAAANVFLQVWPGRRGNALIRLSHRAVDGGKTRISNVKMKVATLAETWLRLDRTGATFTASISLDGTTFTDLGAITLHLPAATRIGIALAAGKKTATASFRDFA